MKWCSSATEVTDTRTLGNPKSSQTTLRNGQHGSEIKAVLKRSSDLKKSKPTDGGNVSVDVCTHCAEEVQQFHMFGTPDIDEKKNIDSVIRYICPLEGTEQGNVPVSLESKFSVVAHTSRTSATRLRSQTRMRHPAYDTDPCYGSKTNVAHQWVKSISDAMDQLHVMCPSDSQDDSRVDTECK